VLCLAAIGFLSSGDLLARDFQVGRYASLIAAPTEAQTNLLSKMVTVKLPSRVKTVGGAVQHLLRGSGYRLAGTSSADPARFDLLSFPLPSAHRSLGPMPLHEALETLGGPAFRLGWKTRSIGSSPSSAAVRACRSPRIIPLSIGGNSHGGRHWRHPVGRRIRTGAQRR
jgi:conjugative transfer region protein (TIGR03748 family)